MERLEQRHERECERFERWPGRDGSRVRSRLRNARARAALGGGGGRRHRAERPAGGSGSSAVRRLPEPSLGSLPGRADGEVGAARRELAHDRHDVGVRDGAGAGGGGDDRHSWLSVQRWPARGRRRGWRSAWYAVARCGWISEEFMTMGTLSQTAHRSQAAGTGLAGADLDTYGAAHAPARVAGRTALESRNRRRRGGSRERGRTRA